MLGKRESVRTQTGQMTRMMLCLWRMAKDRVVSATEFKAKCLAFLDEIEECGAAITVIRRGRPVAVIGPAPRNSWKSPQDQWAARAKIMGDIVNTDTSSLWDVAGNK